MRKKINKIGENTNKGETKLLLLGIDPLTSVARTHFDWLMKIVAK